MMTLRDRLQSGDVWVEGSRAFRAFDDFLLPPEAFATRRRDGELGLAVADRFEDWRDEKTKLLETRLQEVDALAAAGELPEATLTAKDCRSAPSARTRTQTADAMTRRLYGMLPRLRITDLLAEVHGWTGFAERFLHLRSGAPPEDILALMTALLADATNLGLARMARSSNVFSIPSCSGSPNGMCATRPIGRRSPARRRDSRASLHKDLGRRRHFLVGRPVFQGRRPRRSARRPQCQIRLGAGREVLHPCLRSLCAVQHQGHRRQRQRGGACSRRPDAS